MKKLALHLLAFAALRLATVHATAALAVTDQQNTSSNGSSIGSIGGAGSGPGQSFTPALGTLNAVTFSLLTPNAASTVRVDLFSGAGYAGPLLGSSVTLTLTTSTYQTTEFDFASTQTLTPGAVYTLRVTQVGSNNFTLSGSSTNPYAGGSAYAFNGNAVSVLDLVFAEGTADPAAAAPEPSTWAALGLGVAGVGVVSYRRRRRRGLSPVA